jgi:hypothetical protein
MAGVGKRNKKELEDTMKRLMLVLLIGILVLTGCDDSTGTKAQSMCRGGDGPNECTLTLVYINGLYRYDIVKEDVWLSDIEVTAQITVEEGTVRVWLEDREGNQTVVGVEPGRAVELTGLADVTTSFDEDRFSIYFEALGEVKRAENVHAEIRFDTRGSRN